MRRLRGASRRAAGAVFGVLCAAAPVTGQSMSLDSLFRAHRLPLSAEDGRARGPGFWLIQEAARDAQFVMIAESHYLKDAPLFTAHLFETLQASDGFDYVALEQGPHIVELMVRPAVRGDVDALAALSRRYVNGLQFRSDQEIELIARASAASRGAIDPVWGIDNEWGTLHVLESLVPLAGSVEATRVLAELIDSARVYEAERPSDASPRFLVDVLDEEDLRRLETAFAGAGEEADRLLGILRTGFETYAARRDGPSIYRSNDRRERLMRSQFMERYRAAQSAGDSLPRVVLKFGHWHALSGQLNEGGVEPLGSFLGELARSNGMEMLGIWTGLVNEPGHVWTLYDYPEYDALTSAASTDRWWVVDLREVRPYVASGRVTGVNETLRRIIFGYDLALLIGSGDAATFDRLAAP